AGMLQATNGGALVINTLVNNQNGTITSDGTNGSSLVQVNNATVQGGTLTTLNGGVMQTANTSTLDGSTHPARTISAGSTYVASRSGFNDTTNILGTITNNGTLLLPGGNGANGTLNLAGDVTLNGGGTVTLAVNPSGGGTAILHGNGRTLTTSSTTTIQ